MTINEKRAWLKDTVDTIDPNAIERIYNYVLTIESGTDSEKETDSHGGRRITHDELMKAINEVGEKYDNDLRRLAQ